MILAPVDWIGGGLNRRLHILKWNTLEISWKTLSLGLLGENLYKRTCAICVNFEIEALWMFIIYTLQTHIYCLTPQTHAHVFVCDFAVSACVNMCHVMLSGAPYMDREICLLNWLYLNTVLPVELLLFIDKYIASCISISLDC